MLVEYVEGIAVDGKVDAEDLAEEESQGQKGDCYQQTKDSCLFQIQYQCENAIHKCRRCNKHLILSDSKPDKPYGPAGRTPDYSKTGSRRMVKDLEEIYWLWHNTNSIRGKGPNFVIAIQKEMCHGHFFF